MSRRKQKRPGDDRDCREYFHKRRYARPLPDPDVYNWPKEWLPKPDTQLVPANTSALRIDPPKPKPPSHVFENTFYLQSPPKMRSEMDACDFDYNPDVEMERLKNIKKTENELLSTASGRRRTNAEKLNIKGEAEKMVDMQEFTEKTERYTEKKKRDIETMKRVYKERDLGEPPDTSNIVELAMDIKRKVYLKSMKKSNPGYVHTIAKSDQGEVDVDFKPPNDDNNDKTRNITSAILRKSESDLEKSLGVVAHGPEIWPNVGINGAYEVYTKETKCTKTVSYIRKGEATQRRYADGVKPHTVTRDQGQQMTLLYDSEKHMELDKTKTHGHQITRGSSCWYSVKQRDGTSSSLETCDENRSVDERIENPQSKPRMTMWYGRSQSRGFDEDEAINRSLDQNIKSIDYQDKHNNDGVHNSGNHWSSLWWGTDEKMEFDIDKMEGCNKQNLTESHERCDEMMDGKETGSTFTRTVPFLYLGTEDLPHRIRTETYTFQKVPDKSAHNKSNDLQNFTCIIL
ncbi:uncharacterized protein [Argopecten irradians]|uniref:uncharacterized protein n=1 Tax=Argopecten irradians TaxID=31199 RepID=UPI00371F00F3